MHFMRFTLAAGQVNATEKEVYETEHQLGLVYYIHSSILLATGLQLYIRLHHPINFGQAFSY